MRFPADAISVCSRWYAACPLSYRHLEERMQEHGLPIDHSIIRRKPVQSVTLLVKTFCQHKRPVGKGCRMHATFIRMKGAWKCLNRAVDEEGKTVDFLLTAMRNASAVERRFDEAMQHNEVHGTLKIDRRGANKAVLDASTLRKQSEKSRSKFGNSRHSTISSRPPIARPDSSLTESSFQSFRAAQAVSTGIELIAHVGKGQLDLARSAGMPYTERFYTPAGHLRPA